jgi:hypothetical protein
MASIFELSLGQTSEDDAPFMDTADKTVQTQIEAQRGIFGDLAAGFQNTALAGGARRAGDEGTAALETYKVQNPDDVSRNRFNRPGMTAGQMGATLKGIGTGLIGQSHDDGKEFDREATYGDLTADIPQGLHAEIMENPTLEAATRSRARILEDLDRHKVSSLQFDGGGYELIGSLADVDLPLMLGTGGMVGAARIARMTRGGYATGALQGVVGGAQAGAVVGSYDLFVRETADTTALVGAIIGGAALGGTFGVLGGDVTASLHDLEVDYARRVSTDDESLVATNNFDEPASPAQGFESSVFQDPAPAAAAAPTAVPAARPLNDIFREPTASTVSLDDGKIVSKTGDQLIAGDNAAAVLTNTPGFTELEGKFQGSTVTKIAGGTEKVVLDVDGTVVRVSNTPARYGNYENQLRPTHAGMVGDLYVEIVPRVRMDLTKQEIIDFDNQVKADGMHWADANIDNLGRDADGRIVVIDGEVFPTARLGSRPLPSKKYADFRLQDGDEFTPAALDAHPMFAPKADAPVTPDATTAPVAGDTAAPYTPPISYQYLDDGSVVTTTYPKDAEPTYKRTYNDGRVEELDEAAANTLLDDTIDIEDGLDEFDEAGGFDEFGDRVMNADREGGADWVSEGPEIGGNPTKPKKPKKPKGRVLADVPPEQAAVIQHATDFARDTGFEARRAEQTSFLERIAASAWNTATGTGFQARMYTSNSKVMNWLGGAIYESASGINRGRATASVMMENYHKRIQTQLLPLRAARQDWARRNNMGAFGLDYGISKEGQARFNRDIMLERNAREHDIGNGRSTDKNIIRAADAYDSAARDSLAIGKGRDDQISVKGLEAVTDNTHYTPYIWANAKIAQLIKSGVVRRDDIVNAVADGYRKAGMAAGKDADAVAEAVIRRSEMDNAEIDSSVHALLQHDGKEFLREALLGNGVSKTKVDAILRRLGASAEERGREGFAKRRNSIDMSATIKTQDGSNVQIVDLLSNNLDGDWQRYTRRVSGAAALARHGITSREGRKNVIAAIHTEQRRLGEQLTPTDELHAMFTNFDGGAIKGWSALGSGEPSSAGAGASLAKRLVQLAWLNKLGLTQLGETGSMIAQNGIGTWATRGPFARFNEELRKGNKELLDDVSYLTGEIGQDQHLFAAHLDLDEVSDLDKPDLLSKINSKLATASFIQSYTSLFNTVRSSQQKTAALGVVDKVMRTLRDADGAALTPNQYARMWSDLGLDRPTLDRLNGLINDGTIEFAPAGHVNRLNANKWAGDLQDVVGASITRNINQVVQKSMAGEADAWLHTGMGSVLSHLKTFPLLATHKQLIRHFKHNDAQAYGQVMAGFGTALVASMVREAVDQAGGSEREAMTAKEHGKRAFGYSNMTGFLPMAYDPLMTMMGLDDMRFNQYGRHSEIAPPVLSFANDALRLPGALAAAATGNADYDDKKALRTLPFANTMLFGEMITSIGQAQK